MHEPPAVPLLAVQTIGSPEAVHALVDQVRTVLEAIRVASRDLADFPDPEGPRERRLRDLTDHRRQLTADLGTAAVALLASGGRLTAADLVVPDLPRTAPAPEVSPPAPSEAVPEAVPEAGPPSPEAAVEVVPRRTPTTPPASILVAPDPAATTRTRVRSVPAPPPPTMAPPPTVPRTAPSRPARPTPKDLKGHLEAIGRPALVVDAASAAATVDRLMDAAYDLDSWLVYPPDIQQALTGLVSSIARHVQDEVRFPLAGDTLEHLRGFFPTMSYWSKLYRPGFVPGLSRRFGPERDSWLEDAEHWWWLLTDASNPATASELAQRAVATPYRARPVRRDEEPEEEEVDPAEALRDLEKAAAEPGPQAEDLAPLVIRAVGAGVPQRDPRLLKALRPHRELVAEIPGLKTLKTALRSVAEPDPPTDEVAETAPAVPDDWPFLPLTAQKSAVIVGGDRRPQSAERIKDAFRFASVDWEVKDARRLRALSERVRSGSIDLVILLRAFIGHGEQELVLDACRAADVRFVVVDSGYGVNQVRRAIERFGTVDSA